MYVVAMEKDLGEQGQPVEGDLISLCECTCALRPGPMCWQTREGDEVTRHEDRKDRKRQRKKMVRAGEEMRGETNGGAGKG